MRLIYSKNRHLLSWHALKENTGKLKTKSTSYFYSASTVNGELARLLCHNNRISSLDLSQNEKINRLWAFNNPFSPEEEESLATSLRQVSQDDLWISVAPAIVSEHDEVLD